MGKLQIDLPQEKIAEFRKKWKLSEFTFFGSVLRDDFRPDSDIDVLVDFEPGAKPGIFDLVSMTDELKGIFGRKVDLLTRRGVEQSRNYIRRRAILEGADARGTRDTAYLLDILLNAKNILEFAKGLEKDAFLSDRKSQDAIIFCLERIGEAIKRLSPETRTNTRIPWSVMKRVMKRRIKPYDKVDLNDVWDSVEQDIPSLISYLEKLIPPEDKT